MKRVTAGDRKRLLNQFSGVKLYRDDFKVRPYGDEGALYDWLGMGAVHRKVRHRFRIPVVHGAYSRTR